MQFADCGRVPVAEESLEILHEIIFFPKETLWFEKALIQRNPAAFIRQELGAGYENSSC